MPRIVFAVSLLVFIFLGLSNDAFGSGPSSPASSGKKLREIYDAYFTQGSIEKAIDLLSEAILNGELRYTKANLQDTVLLILKDYYVRETQPKTFENLIYHIIDGGTISTIKRYFSDTDLMVNVNDALRRWETPFSIAIHPEYTTIQVGQSVKFSVIVRNNLNKTLKGAKLQHEVKPEASGEFNMSTLTFKALGKGTASLVFQAGNARGSATIDVRALPGPIVEAITPELGPPGMKVTIEGQNFAHEPQENTVFFGETSTVADSVETGQLYLKVPDETPVGPTFITVKTPIDEHKSQIRFQVIPPPDPPSRKWAYISSGVTVVGAASYGYFTSKARDESNKCEEAGTTDCPDYDSASTMEKVSIGITVAAAAATSYLWYKYWKDNNEYKDETAELFGKANINVMPYPVGVVVSYNF